MLTKSSAKRTATHPETAAERSSSWEPAGRARCHRVIAGTKAVFEALSWTSVLKDMLGQILFPVEKALGQGVFIRSIIAAHESEFPPYKGLFQAPWEQGGTCEVVTGSLIFLKGLHVPVTGSLI